MTDHAQPPASARDTWLHDFFASIVVFLVALPLCLGIAIASGAPPAAGLITGIVGGLIVGTFAGSPLQVSGPAAGLAVIVFEIIQTHGIGMLGPIVLVAGLLQLAAGIAGFGRWFRAISPAVIQGMLAGIGLLIVASQLHVMVDDRPRGSGLANLFAIPEAIAKGIFPMDGSAHHLAAAVGIVTIGVTMAWSWAPESWRRMPAPLVGAIFGTALAAILELPIRYVDLPDNLAGAIMIPGLSELGAVLGGAALASAATLAVVASAETMLTAAAADRMHTGPRTDYDRELRAQGIGNTICGVLGALPMTGVIVRTSANIQAGARTRWSTVMHGAWILLFVAALPWVLERVPLTALAALLVYTGFKLLSPHAVRELAKFGRGEVAIYFVTLTAIVATNLLEGIVIGFTLALARMLWALSRLEVRRSVDPASGRIHLDLVGAGTFLAVPTLMAELDKVPQGADLTVELAHLRHVDHAFLETLMAWERQHAARNGRFTLDWDGLHALHEAGRKRSGTPEPALAQADGGSVQTGSGELARAGVAGGVMSTPGQER